MSRVTGRAVRVTALALAVVSAYALGAHGSGASSPRSDPGVVDEAVARMLEDSAAPTDRARLERAAVEGALAALGDRWSSYYTAGEYAAYDAGLEGRYTGIGIWIQPGASGSVRVGAVTDGSPADRASVQVGDALLRVSGRPVRGRSVSDIAGLLRGPSGSTVSLAVRRDGRTRLLTVVRSTVKSTDVSVQRLEDDVTVVRLTAFTRGVGEQVRAAVAQRPSAASTGVVLDLRGNPGGLLTEAVAVASAFLETGPVVTYERRGLGRQVLATSGPPSTRAPVVVLVDSTTASAAEIVAAALQDRGRAVIVGRRTFGKGSVQEPALLSDGSALELTVGRYVTPGGRSLDGVGIEPDVATPADRPALALDRALNILTGLTAASGSGRG